MLKMAVSFEMMALLFFLSQGVQGSVQLPSWFGDNMVLQWNSEYGSRAFLNGLASPGEAVAVAIDTPPDSANSLSSSTFNTVAKADGTWIVEILGTQCRNDDGGCTFTVTSPSTPTPIKATGVHFGEVFFCSGQSNMVFPLSLTLNATADLETVASYPNFRYFQTAETTSDKEEFTVKPAMNWAGANASVVKDFSAVCFLTVRETLRIHGLPMTTHVGLVQSAVGGTRIEAWMPKEAFKSCSAFPAPTNTKSDEVPSALFNGMIAPFQYMSVRAALWYQGEANADQLTGQYANEDWHTAAYACKLQAMVASWRERKGMGDFAFLNVQLPPSTAAQSITKPTGRQSIRAAAARAVSRSGGLTDISGMAVCVDLGGASAWGVDHPINKDEISRRLALQLVHVAYAKQQDQMPLWTGPVLSDATLPSLDASSGDVTITFEAYSAVGLKLRDAQKCTACCKGATPFELGFPVTPGSSNMTWRPVAPTFNAQNNGHVVLPGGGGGGGGGAKGTPKAVRYAWHDFTECVLVNSDDLPLGPFKTTLNPSLFAATKTVAGTVVGVTKDTPIQSPPLGFNSWNYYHCNIDENEIKAIALAMVSNGMRDAGYEYINIDDCWQVGRDNVTGAIIADPARFPSGMKAVADFVHSQGLKFGVYTARGSKTCQNRPGSYNYELVDAQTYCDWGLDYLKNDNCGGTNWPQENTSWINFKKGFDKCYAATGKYIVKSIEYCRDPTASGCGAWIGDVANLWRTEGDIQNTWESVYGNIHGNDMMAPVAKPGAFNDPDMLQVGNVGLTLVESRTHFAYWCIAAAPLLAGTDIVHASNETLAILTNKRYLEVNQDLGIDGKIQGRLLGGSTGKAPGPEVWFKKMADGKRTAVLLVNGANAAASDVTINWSDVGLSGSLLVTDLWTGDVLGKHATSYTARAVEVHSHQFIMIYEA